MAHLYHLYGERDHVQSIGRLAFPGRWPIFKHSSWNRAAAKGQITLTSLGPMEHTGAGGYFDRTSKLPDGTSFLDATVERIASPVLSRSPRDDARRT